MSDWIFERSVRDWLEDGTDRTPPHAIEAVLLAVKTTPQERDLAIPRRFTTMPMYLRLAAAVAVIAVAGFGALTFLGNGSNAGSSDPPATPTAAPTAAPPSSTPIPSPSAQPTSAPSPGSSASSFVSRLYGYTFTVPAGWSASSAASPWPEGLPLIATYADYFQGPAGAAEDFDDAVVAAQPVPEGMTAEAWLGRHAEQQATSPRDCKGEVDDWTDVVVGSLPTRRVDLECEGIRLSDVAFVLEGTGYAISGNREFIDLFLEGFDPGS